MSSLKKATLEEIQQTASRICRDYLTGRWKEVSPEQLIVKRISGGLSNFLYYVSLPHKVSGDDIPPKISEDDNVLSVNERKDNNVCSNVSSTVNINNTNGESSPLKNTTRTKASTSSLSITQNDENSDESVCRALLGVHFNTNTNGFNNNGYNGHLHQHHHQHTNIKRKRCDSGSSAISALAQHSTEPQEVLLRIYGQSHGEDALEAMITESVVFALLSERNFGPKLHGIFPGGRIEQYIPARALLTTELSIKSISKKIAEKMGEIHSLNIPLSKEPDWLWNCMQRWLKQLPSILTEGKIHMDWQRNDPTKQRDVDCIEFVNNFNFLTEVQWLKSIIDMGNYPVAFCHNDLQEGNILMRRDNITSKINKSIQEEKEICGNFSDDSDEPDLIIIDFEYCAYNYRSFDLANHFLEWTFDYSNPQFPFFYHHKIHYPTKEERKHFIKNYFKKFHDYDFDGDNNDGDDDANQLISANDVEIIEKEIEIFSMLSHLFWSLWSVVNTTSNIEFGYWDYAVARMKEYQLLKQQFLRNINNIKNGVDVGDNDNHVS